MPRVQVTKTNFAKGELAPRAMMRADTGAYQDAVATATNAMLLAHGGERRRPGTRFIADLTIYGTLRLETFSQGPNKAFLFVFHHQGLRVYDTTGALAWTFGFQPWTAAMLPQLSVTQSGNAMIVAHPDLKPQVIRRLPPSSFTAEPLVFGAGGRNAVVAPSFQPFHRFFDTESITIQPSGYSGTVTVTASASLFSKAWEGAILRYAGTEIMLVTHNSSTEMVGACRETLGKAYNYTVSDTAGFLTGQRIKSTAGDAEAVITAVTPSTLTVLMLDRAQAFEFDVDVTRYLISGTTSAKMTGPGTLVATPPATLEWDEPAFSTVRGWPNCVAFHEQRLVFGGSRALPNRLWFSAVADYFNFDPGLGEDDAAFAVEVSQVSEIRHLVSFRHLAVFTDGGEFYIPQSDSQPLTVNTVSVRRQTSYGASYVHPVIFDGSILYAQLSNRAIREFIYTDLETAYASNPMSVLSSHLITGPVDMDVQVGADSNEEQYAFVVNADGTLAVFHGLRKEEIAGWTPWTTHGKFKRVRVVDGFVFLIVERTVNEVPVLYLERLDLDLTLDCAIDNEVATASPVAEHLAGLTAHAVDRTAYYGAWTVAADGTVQGGPLAAPVPACVLGLDYTHTLVTLPVVTIGGQNVGGLPKRILSVAVWIDESVTFDVQGHHLAVYTVGDDFGAVPNAKTGAHEFRLLGWTRSAQVTITQAYPLPLTVLGIQMEVSY